MDSVGDFLVALVPSAGVILLFWLAIRSIIQADRRERAAQERIQGGQVKEPMNDDTAATDSEIPRSDA